MAEPGALITILIELLDECDEEFEEANDRSCVILHMASVTGVQDERRNAVPQDSDSDSILRRRLYCN